MKWACLALTLTTASMFAVTGYHACFGTVFEQAAALMPTLILGLMLTPLGLATLTLFHRP